MKVDMLVCARLTQVRTQSQGMVPQRLIFPHPLTEVRRSSTEPGVPAQAFNPSTGRQRKSVDLCEIEASPVHISNSRLPGATGSSPEDMPQANPV